MFRFKSGTFQFVLLFIYIQNKQKTHERKRTVLEIFPYHHYTGIRTYFIYKNVSFHGRYFRSMHHLHLVPLSLAVWLLINKLQTVNVDTTGFIHTVTNLADWLHTKTGYDLLSTENISSIASILPAIGQFLMGSISSFAVNAFVLVFILYFMLIGGNQMEKYIYELLPFSDTNKKNVLKEINMIVRSNAIGIPLLAVIQGGIATLGYYLFDVPSALLFGFLTCFATVIPIVGTALVWFPLAAYLALSGDWTHAAGLLLYCGLIVTNIDNLIRFILQKKMADTHPLITIFGVVIGLSLFGFMGVIFGPLLLSIFILCVNIFKTQYLK